MPTDCKEALWQFRRQNSLPAWSGRPEFSGPANWIAIPRQYLRQAKDRGLVRQVGRGLYVAEGSRVTEHHTLVEASKRVPHGVICLLSALRFHNLTTQMPFEVWLAIDRRARRPKDEQVPLRVFRFSELSLTSGVEEHVIEGVPVKVYNPAKTVASSTRAAPFAIAARIPTR